MNRRIKPRKTIPTGLKTRIKTKAYCRVSTEQQDLDKFKPAIYEFAASKGFKLTEADVVAEKVSGKINWRKRKLGLLIDELNKGDNLIIPELSRFSRSMTELLEVLQILKEKRVNVYVLKGALFLNEQIDDPVTDLIVRILSTLSEFERELISLRIKEGLKARKASGKSMGRPKGAGKSKLDDFKPEIITLLKNGSTKTFIAQRYKTSAANLLNWLKKNDINVKQTS